MLGIPYFFEWSLAPMFVAKYCVKDNIIVIIWSNQPELVTLIVCNIILL